MRLACKIVGCVLLSTVLARAGGPPAHAPISISSDQDFVNCACVTGGSGTTVDPYIVGPWTINGSGTAVLVDGSGGTLTKSFVILNLTAAGNGRSADRGIVLQNITGLMAAVLGKQTTIQSENVGITVLNSSYVTLDGGGANPKGPGIGNTGAGTINKNVNGGIDVENSGNITVRGWQLSANGSDNSPDWVGLDPSTWGVGGVRFFGVTNSLIDHNASNNCTDISFSLFNSNNNSVTSNTADYPFTTNFMVADGSSHNTLAGNVASTADFIGYLVADPLPGAAASSYGPSHDNVLTSNISHTDGPTGNEIKGGVVPAFLGGFVVLNGTYNNVITNNQDWSSTGSGFAWAQAVPNAATPIGVDTYPPVLHCNVTVSDGGGGVGNRNGNLWSGNVTQTIDPCLPAQ